LRALHACFNLLRECTLTIGTIMTLEGTITVALTLRLTLKLIPVVVVPLVTVVVRGRVVAATVAK